MDFKYQSALWPVVLLRLLRGFHGCCDRRCR
jgi:hypothetical protein